MEDKKEEVVKKETSSSIWRINKILMNLIRFIILSSVLILLGIIMKGGYELLDKIYDKAHVFSMDFSNFYIKIDLDVTCSGAQCLV